MPVPVPGIADDLFHTGMLRFPAQHAKRERGVGHKTGRVSRTAWAHAVLHGQAGDAFDGVEYLLDRKAGAGAEVHGHAFTVAARDEAFHGFDVGRGEVEDMDIVADAGAVGRGVVVAHDVEVGQSAVEGHEGAGDEMGFRIVAFACFAFRVGTSRVEVAQGRPRDAVRAGVVGQHTLHEHLGLTVGIDGVQLEVFGDGHGLGDAVHGGCAGYHDIAHTGLAHGFEYVQSAAHIVADVFARLLHRFAHLREGREMDDAIGAHFAQAFTQACVVEDVALEKRAPLHQIAVAGGKIVVHGDAVAAAGQRLAGAAADISGTADDEDVHAGSVRRPRRIRSI